MSVLRVYDPPECDAAGVPLDWERCRTCEGTGRVGVSRDMPTSERPPATSYERNGVLEAPCPTCEGHGSLKATAFTALLDLGRATSVESDRVFRCEGCGHRMSDGTWDGEDTFARSDERLLRIAETELAQGIEPDFRRVSYSPCDEGCTHGGLGRVHHGNRIWRYSEFDGKGRDMIATFKDVAVFEASWRPVDVRTLGWAHDLRPEKLAVLCLRCWAART